MTKEKMIRSGVLAAIDENDLAKAESVCRKALEEHGENERIETMLAKVLRLRKKTPEAEAAYLDIMRRHGRTPFAVVGLAAVYMDAEKYPEAEDLCKEALKLSPKNVPATRTLGMVYARRGDKNRARNCFAMIGGARKAAA